MPVLGTVLGANVAPDCPANSQTANGDAVFFPDDISVSVHVGGRDHIFQCPGHDRGVRFETGPPESEAWIELPRNQFQFFVFSTRNGFRW